VPGRQKLAALRLDSEREDHIVERDGKFVLLSKKDPGKVLGTHATRAEAVKQEQAIEASKHADSPEQGPAIGAPLEAAKVRTPGEDVAPLPTGVAVSADGVAKMQAGAMSYGFKKQDCQRIDVFHLDGAPERTPQGGLKLPAYLTRTGVFEYQDGAGGKRREYRPPGEVFDAASLKSLEDAPVTDLHQGMVSAETFQAMSKGHVRDVRKDGRLVGATVLVQDAGLVAAVERGDRREISCGYACKLDMTPGTTPEGETYDAVQTEIRYNHAALLPRGAGRAGPEVALRLDGAAYTLHNEDTTMKIRFDGKDYDLSDAAQRAAFETAVAASQARLDSNITALATITAERDAANKARDVARADAADARDPAKMALRIAKRVKLEAQARELLGSETKFDGLTNAQVREKAVLHADSSVKERLDAYLVDGKPAGGHGAYLKARFDALFSQPSLGTARQALFASQISGQVGQPGGDDSPSQLSAWRQPLAASKDKR